MNDRGSIVVGWLARLAILFALLGVGAFDLFTVVQANVGASDAASDAAREAAANYSATRNIQSAYDAAVKSLSNSTDRVETKNFSVDSTGIVTLTLDRTTKTLWMSKIGPLKHWTHVRQTGTGAPPS